MLDGPASGEAVVDICAGEGSEVLASCDVRLSELGQPWIELSATVDRLRRGCEVRIIGTAIEARISGLEIDLVQHPDAHPAPDRAVGYESSKTYAAKIKSGFFDRFLGGEDVLELGYKGYWGDNVPIVPQAVGVDIGYPGYNGVTLPFADDSFDAIYSSHCFEHIPDYRTVLRDWYRVLRMGGYIVIVVPHRDLFEKRIAPPSRGNPDHKRFYTPQSLLTEIAESYPVNSYRIRHLAENDAGFNYQDPPGTPSFGQFEIELVVQKIVQPYWNLDDGTVRPYGASEFDSDCARPDLWTIDVDLANGPGGLFWGPYTALQPARYTAVFHFEPSDFSQTSLAAEVTFDILSELRPIAATTLSGAAGADMLRRGAVRLDFELTPARSEQVEFRMLGSGRGTGRLRFKGLDLQYQR